MEGVEAARFAYPEGTALVRYDPARTTPEAFVDHLTQATGFEARVVIRQP